jgi:hypothetical protein
LSTGSGFPHKPKKYCAVFENEIAKFNCMGPLTNRMERIENDAEISENNYNSFCSCTITAFFQGF